ncbi:MAG: flagellar basal body-associated FliL family protein [Luminiphilus sp.]|nr:flagellar basal body-associated FliL family protein [Luminiphilus sp.]
MADDTSPKKKKKPSAQGGSNDAASDRDADQLEEGGGGKRKLFLLIGIAVLMLALGAGAGYFAGGMRSDDTAATDGVEEEEAREEKKREKRHNIYVTVGKLLAAVEHNGGTRYIQAEVDLVGYEKEIMDDAQHNVPALRNRLLLLFSSQDFDEVRTIAGRERLRLQSLKAVNDVLELDPKGDRVEDVYFTAFVIQ